MLIGLIRYGNKNTGYYNYINKNRKDDYCSGSYYIDNDNNCNDD